MTWWRVPGTMVTALVAACASVPELESSTEEPGNILFDASRAIQDQWQHIPLRGETEYRIAILDGKIAIRARGRESASMLVRRVSIDPIRCPIISWSWSVTSIQESADLKEKNREDVAASLFVLFGDPGTLFDPKPVPTVRYVWTNSRVEKETVIDNPYLPGVVRSIVLRNDLAQPGVWVAESRNLVSDYGRAFETTPQDGIHAIALFTDNDQTGEPVEAYYGTGSVRCTS